MVHLTSCIVIGNVGNLVTSASTWKETMTFICVCKQTLSGKDEEQDDSAMMILMVMMM